MTDEPNSEENLFWYIGPIGSVLNIAGILVPLFLRQEVMIKIVRYRMMISKERTQAAQNETTYANTEFTVG